MRATHFVGFRGDEYNRARRVFGEPDFIHMGWDRRAFREIADGDRVVFANDARPHILASHNYPDLHEREWTKSPYFEPWMDPLFERKGYQVGRRK